MNFGRQIHGLDAGHGEERNLYGSFMVCDSSHQNKNLGKLGRRPLRYG
jgi:hypothetical protein